MSTAQAVYVRAPRAGETYKFATATSSVVYKTPASWKGRWVRFYAENADIYVAFTGVTGQTITATAVATVNAGSREMEVNGQSAPLAASSGSFTDWYCLKPKLPTDTTGEEYFMIVGSNAAGYWSAHVSDHGHGVPV